MHQKINVGTKVYVLLDGLKLLRTINYSNNNIFEWRFGWAYTKDIQINPDTKSKVKYIINNLTKFYEQKKHN
jgi:hypothetical protein